MSDKIQLIAMRMRDLREISGMSAEEVAEKSGVNADVYKEYESGSRDFSFSHLFNIAETLGVDISDLLTGESPRLQAAMSLTRKGKGLEFHRREAYHYEHLAYNFRDKKSEPFIVTVACDGDNLYGKDTRTPTRVRSSTTYWTGHAQDRCWAGNEVYPVPGRFDLLRFVHPRTPCTPWRRTAASSPWSSK